jgi:transposase
VVLLNIVLYGVMELYSSRALAKACGQNINFMWLLQSNPPPNRHRAVWRKNVDRYEEGQKEKIRGIIRELNRSEGTAFSEAGEGIPEKT